MPLSVDTLFPNTLPAPRPDSLRCPSLPSYYSRGKRNTLPHGFKPSLVPPEFKNISWYNHSPRFIVRTVSRPNVPSYQPFQRFSRGSTGSINFLTDNQHPALHWSRLSRKHSPDHPPDPIAEDMFLRKIRQSSKPPPCKLPLSPMITPNVSPRRNKSMSLPTSPRHHLHSYQLNADTKDKRDAYRRFACIPFSKPLLLSDTFVRFSFFLDDILT